MKNSQIIVTLTRRGRRGAITTKKVVDIVGTVGDTVRALRETTGEQWLFKGMA